MVGVELPCETIVTGLGEAWEITVTGLLLSDWTVSEGTGWAIDDVETGEQPSSAKITMSEASHKCLFILPLIGMQSISAHGFLFPVYSRHSHANQKAPAADARVRVKRPGEEQSAWRGRTAPGFQPFNASLGDVIIQSIYNRVRLAYAW